MKSNKPLISINLLRLLYTYIYIENYYIKWTCLQKIIDPALSFIKYLLFLSNVINFIFNSNIMKIEKKSLKLKCNVLTIDIFSKFTRTQTLY